MLRVEIVAGLMLAFVGALRAVGFDRYPIRVGYRLAERVDRWWSR